MSGATDRTYHSVLGWSAHTIKARPLKQGAASSTGEIKRQSTCVCHKGLSAMTENRSGTTPKDAKTHRYGSREYPKDVALRVPSPTTSAQTEMLL